MNPIYLAGPTAVGKSAVALRLAEQLGGEIISVDSMQVYRGLDIGTAKPSTAERAQVPHHLIDVCELGEQFDAAEFARQAEAAIAAIQGRGRIPILCGGTGLYFSVLLNGLGEAPPANEAIRADLKAIPMADLLRELEQADPATYARIDRQNPRRVIRALEVIRITGKPYSEQRAQWNPLPASGKPIPRFVGFQRSPEDSRRRSNSRVDHMFASGLVEETRSLLALGLEQNQTAMQAIGYRQVVEHLKGQRDLKETIELVKIRTRQFAKRQLTWFRRQMPIQWLTITEAESTENVTEQVLALVKTRP